MPGPKRKERRKKQGKPVRREWPIDAPDSGIPLYRRKGGKVVEGQRWQDTWQRDLIRKQLLEKAPRSTKERKRAKPKGRGNAAR